MFGKLIKRACLVLGLTAAQHVGAFTLWGPLESWQTADLDYSNPPGSIRYYYWWAANSFDIVENGGPKNFGQGSRLTTPIITYGFDNTFETYFGAKGVAAVTAAMNFLNGLPSASSANLNNFPTAGVQQINYTAQALGLLDLKSTVLWMMAEHMGLLGETHIYDMRARVNYGSEACDFEYFVINHNYDPGTYNPSTYVNGRMYDYSIWDGCPIGISVGATAIFPEDTTATRYSAVATGQGLALGAYYINMTRDDMGGLKYLYNKGNYAYQMLDSNSVATPISTITSPWTIAGSTPVTNAGISNFVGLVGGVEKITFVKVNYDSLLNTYFNPITYKYTIPYVTNSKLYQLQVTRTVTAPDIIFTAADLVIDDATPPTDTAFSRSGTFIQTPYVSPGGGVLPSTIDPTELVILNNVGPIYYNMSPHFLDSTNLYAYPVFIWGSFDGTTNAPVVYPKGASVAELEAEVLQGGSQTSSSNSWGPVINTNSTTTGTGVSTGVVAASVH